MKSLIFLVLIVLTITVSFCDKPEDNIVYEPENLPEKLPDDSPDDLPDNLPDDKIVYRPIDKIITKSAPDSIIGTCYDLIFEIKELNQSNTAIIGRNNEGIMCDGFDDILVDETGWVLPLGKGQVISQNNNWSRPNNLCLDDFAGKGEMYIGYRSGSYPSGITYYYYGWIKVELSSDIDTLRLIEKANNCINNKFIKSGQIE